MGLTPCSSIWIPEKSSRSSTDYSTDFSITPREKPRSNFGAFLLSDGNFRLDVRMRLIAFEREILIAERENIPNLRIEAHVRQRIGLARELLARLVEMIEIEMRGAEG